MKKILKKKTQILVAFKVLKINQNLCLSNQPNNSAKFKELPWLFFFVTFSFLKVIGVRCELKNEKLSSRFVKDSDTLPQGKNNNVFIKQQKQHNEPSDKHFFFTMFQKNTSNVQDTENAEILNLVPTSLLKKRQVLKKKYFSYLNRFLINFIQFLFQSNVQLSFKKLWKCAQNLEKANTHKKIILKIRKYAKKLKSYKLISNFYKILWISMRVKDSSFFLKWFCYRVELLFYKFHKNVPHLLNTIFKQFHSRLFKQTQTKGMFFSLSGKISVTGDSKKRHIYIKYGKHSSTTKNLNLTINKSQIRTRTGVMGVVFGVFF